MVVVVVVAARAAATVAVFNLSYLPSTNVFLIGSTIAALQHPNPALY